MRNAYLQALRARGVTVVEACVAVAVFSLFASVIYTTVTASQSLARRAEDRSKALWLAEEGIEAARSLRDQNFTNLAAGTYGLSIASSSWAFSGSSDVADGFTRQVAIGVRDIDSRYATSTVTWNDRGVTQTALLATVLTNWRRLSSGAAATTIDTSSSCVYTLDQRYLAGVRLVNDGTAGATSVTVVNVSWTPVGTQSMQQIFAPYPTAVWNGTVASGATTTLSTPIAFSGAGNVTLSFRWNGLVTNKTFTLTFIFADGSTKSTTITPALITVCL